MRHDAGGIDEQLTAYVRERGDHHLRVAVPLTVDRHAADDLVQASPVKLYRARAHHDQHAPVLVRRARRKLAGLPALSLGNMRHSGWDEAGVPMRHDPGYGMLRDLFADPALAASKRYADVLREYLRSETIAT